MSLEMPGGKTEKKIAEKICEMWPRWRKAAWPVRKYAGWGFLDAMYC